ncbi:MAG TPA: ABC transporter substrate-binding protein, partial [Anaeromyxobacteraceae bacterium]|nr:ABC transporter substrate-binding protein [Anaeromyxobacteraceae bacterium]
MLVSLAAFLVVAPACTRDDAARPFRLGYFPNLTHAQALVGAADGSFSKALGGKFETRLFNAGPAAMEALVAGDLDASFVGPGPAVIAYLRTKGEAIAIVAGAMSGGALLVARPEIGSPKDLVGRRVACPQIGNTQDIALRTWLRAQGLKEGEGEGAVRVTPLENPEILALYAKGELAAAWVPEPWASRLLDAGARILVDERTLWEGGAFQTTVIAVSRRALERRRADVVALVRAHVELTERWRRDPDAFRAAANGELAKLAGKPLP